MAVYLPGEMMLRCRIRPAPAGVLLSASEAPQDAGPGVKAQDCCDREITGSARPVVEAARRADPGSCRLASVATASRRHGAEAFPAPTPGRAQRYGPARGRPPTVLVSTRS